MNPTLIAVIINGLLDLVNTALDAYEQSQGEGLSPEERAALNARTQAMVARANRVLALAPEP